jgi:dipeptidyl aminopeptidase/acylaminoacyl peptidase
VIEVVPKMPIFRKIVAFPTLALTFSCALAAERPESFTLAQSIAAHATLRLEGGDLIVAPGGRYVAWADGDSLMIAAAPGFEPRQLVAVEGGDLGATYASTDGEWLYYVRGAATKAFGPYPAEDARELWRVSVKSAKAERLARGAAVPSGEPVFAPDGSSFVTIDGQMLYRHRVEGGALRTEPLLKNDAQHYASVRLSSLSFSPDGSKLAYVSWRKAGQSFVTILDLASGEYRYVDAGIFRDLSPVWSPDGREVAFVRMPGNWTREYRFTPVKEGVPWSLMIASAADGKVRTLWRADEGAGSVYVPFGAGSWIEGENEQTALSWTPSGQILFPWEKTGWTSLYALPSKGGVKPRQLTPGVGEVTLPALSPDGASVVYAGTMEDPARLHLWRVSVDGGAPKRLTQGGGVEHSPKLLADGSIAYIGNTNGRMPNSIRMIRSSGGSAELTPAAKEKADQRAVWEKFVDAEVVPVEAADGLVSYHLVMTPRGKPPKDGYPVIVASKGGPTGRVSPGNTASAALAQYAVSRGYVFVEINYRGCTGFGLEYRLPEGRGATGGSEVKDLEALALYLRGRADVDASRIGIMGGSYGGHMVGLALSRLPQYYAAGAHLSGVSDWVIEMKMDDLEGWPSAPPEYIRLSERVQIEDLAFESSPPAHLAAWRAPTLFTMGELDMAGHMESIIDLGNRLMQQGVHVEFSIAPEAGHSGPRARPPEKVFDFFERMMRGRR